MPPLTRKQIIGGGVLLAVVVLGAIGGLLYYLFGSKDTPVKPPAKPPPAKTDPPKTPPAKTDPPKTKNTEPVVIKGIGENKEVIITDKDKLVDSMGPDQLSSGTGCWSLDSFPEWKDKLKNGWSCAVASIKLPADIKAKAWTTSGGWNGLCKGSNFVMEIPAGTTHEFGGTTVCGFSFARV